MYGVITTVPAPVQMYDSMHAEMIKRVSTSEDMGVRSRTQRG